ncbi:MAG: GGDEF domain-containing protein [Candidatus Nanoarchaeia archaeon]
MANKLEKIIQNDTAGYEYVDAKSSSAGISDYIKNYFSRTAKDIKTRVKSSQELLADFLTGGNYKALLRENAKLKEQVETDSLTGLYNKRKLKNDLEAQISQYKRHGNEFSLVMMDIDYFKQINDTYGHETGDEILSKVGKLFKEYTRTEDKVYRYGGEEFCVIMPQTDKKGANKAAERLRQTLSTYAKNGLPTFTMSAGVSSYGQGETGCDLIKRADEALYKAKNNGRNCLYSN